MAERVCRYCKQKDDIGNMIAIQNGKRNKYYHQNCYDKEQKENKIKQQDNKEKDQLITVVCDIYEIETKDIPKTFYMFLANIRNGNPVFGKKKNDIKHKQGYSYLTIMLTYKYCKKLIIHVRNKKRFDSISGELNYGLYIIMDKIWYINQKVEARERSIKASQAKPKNKNSYVNNYKKDKTKHETDISAFLD